MEELNLRCLQLELSQAYACQKVKYLPIVSHNLFLQGLCISHSHFSINLSLVFSLSL